MGETKLTGAERLRRAVGIINVCNESFLDRYNSEELLRLVDCMLASGWDIYPDTWAPRQVEQALTAGTAPKWFDDERTPRYAGEQYRVSNPGAASDEEVIVFRGNDEEVAAYMGKRDWPRHLDLDSEEIAATRCNW